MGDLHVQIEPRGTLHYEDPLVGDDCHGQCHCVVPFI